MTSRQRVGLWALLGLALLTRVLLVVTLEDGPFFYQPIVDGAAYDRWAVDISTRSVLGERVFYQDPLYPYGLALFYKVFGRDLLAARLAQCVLGVFGLWMLFEGTRRFLGYRAAMIALAMGAFYKTLIFFDAALLKDFLGVMAVEAALLFASLEKRWKWLAFGAALGIGTLVRANMALLALAAAVVLAVRRDGKSAGLVLAGTLAAILPVTIRNAAVAGDFVLTTSQFGPNLWTGNNPENTSGRYRPPSFVTAASPEFEEAGFRAEAERARGRPLKASEVDAYWRGRALSYIVQNFGTFITVTAKRLAMLLAHHEIPDDLDLYFMERYSWVLKLPLFTFGFFAAPLAAAGICLSWGERKRFALHYVLLGAYALSILLFFMFARYRLPLVPLLLFFAAYAVDTLLRTRQVPRAAIAAFAVASVLSHAPWPESVVGHKGFRTVHYNVAVHYRQAGRHAEAAREFEEAARLDKDFLSVPMFVNALADSLDRCGEDGKALEHFLRLAVLNTASPDPPYRAGRIYHRQGMGEQAARQFTDALIRDPKFMAAYVPLAEAQVRLRRFDDAVRTLDRAAAVAPKEWTIRLARAELYRDLGMWREARVAAEEALALRPGAEAALKIRDQAREKLGN